MIFRPGSVKLIRSIRAAVTGMVTGLYLVQYLPPGPLVLTDHMISQA